MYVCHDYYEASKTALVYPGEMHSKTCGRYLHQITKEPIDKECSIMQLSTRKTINEWQQSIYKEFADWAGVELDKL